MSKFKVGDLVEREHGSNNTMFAGDRGVVTEVVRREFGEFQYKIKGYPTSGTHHLEDRLKLITSKVKVPSENSKGYSFTVTSLTAINETELMECVSAASPLALIEFKDKRFVVIHDSIFVKGIYCKGGEELSKKLEDLLHYSVFVEVFEVHIEDIKEVVSLVKQIKYAPYEKAFRDSGTVKVRLLSV